MSCVLTALTAMMGLTTANPPPGVLTTLEHWEAHGASSTHYTLASWASAIARDGVTVDPEVGARLLTLAKSARQSALSRNIALSTACKVADSRTAQGIVRFMLDVTAGKSLPANSSDTERDKAGGFQGIWVRSFVEQDVEHLLGSLDTHTEIHTNIMKDTLALPKGISWVSKG